MLTAMLQPKFSTFLRHIALVFTVLVSSVLTVHAVGYPPVDYVARWDGER